MSEDKSDQLSAEEADRRFKAALRGARKVGPKPMTDVTPRRPKPKPKSRKEQKSK